MQATRELHATNLGDDSSDEKHLQGLQIQDGQQLQNNKEMVRPSVAYFVKERQSCNYCEK